MKTRQFFVVAFLFCFAITTHIQAQQPIMASASPNPNPNYQDDLDARFSPLDKSQIPTGCLYSRVYPAAQLLTFNQNGQQDVSSAGHFKQAYSELYNSLYNKGNWPVPSDFQELLTDYGIQGKGLLGVISQDINYFKDDAIANNQLYAQNGYLYDTPNRTASPYGTVRTFVAANLIDKVKVGTTTFEFPSWLFISNHSVTVYRLDVDFGEGGFRTFYPNNSHAVTFTSAGEKTIRLTAYFTNGSTQTTYAAFSAVGSNSATSSPCDTRRVIAEQDFAGYVPELGQNIPNQGDAGYYFASLSTTDNGRDCNRTRVRKPVIILDGFDPKDGRKIKDIYEEKLKYGPSGRNIIQDDLIPDNYDVVILNFPSDMQIGTKTINFLGFNITYKLYRDGGSDYIQRNAFVLVKLIKQLNEQMQAEGSTEKITIIGPSMGGLISRYALAYMEQQNLAHNCKLWVSFDSPHHGANIPIGDQLFLNYLGNSLG